MKDDTYVRVSTQTSIRSSFLGTGEFTEYVPDVTGELKVVPADAIVIEHGDLPEVVNDNGRYRVDGELFYGDGGPHTDRSSLAWTYALRDLALAEYLRKHPPVDEAEVERVASLLDFHGDLNAAEADRVARRLVEHGVRVESKP